MFHLSRGVLHSRLIACGIWLMMSHATPAMAESMASLASDHEDTVAANPRLSLHEVLQQVVAIHPQQSLLAAHQQMVQARRTMAPSSVNQNT